jgi:ankyrin repeat protein
VRAVADGDRFETRKILSQEKLDSRDLGQALVWAGAEGDTNTVRVLLSSGANVNAQDHKGNTALMAAAAYNNVRAVKVLLDAGANRTIKNKNGETALSIASNTKYAEVIRLLSY